MTTAVTRTPFLSAQVSLHCLITLACPTRFNTLVPSLVPDNHLTYLR